MPNGTLPVPSESLRQSCCYSQDMEIRLYFLPFLGQSNHDNLLVVVACMHCLIVS